MILHLDDLESAPSSGGRIWLTIGEHAFPEEGWYDLPGVLLNYWAPVLESFGQEHTDFCKLSFMDGPYSVGLSREQDGVWVTCVERGREVLERRIDLPLFLESVRRCQREYERVRYLGTKA